MVAGEPVGDLSVTVAESGTTVAGTGEESGSGLTTEGGSTTTDTGTGTSEESGLNTRLLVILLVPLLAVFLIRRWLNSRDG